MPCINSVGAESMVCPASPDIGERLVAVLACLCFEPFWALPQGKWGFVCARAFSFDLRLGLAL